MLPIFHGDARAAAIWLRRCNPAQRGWVLTRLFNEAECAHLHRQISGREHPRWGDGSLMAAALRRGTPSEPPLSDRDYCLCLAQVYRFAASCPDAQAMHRVAVGS